MLVTAQWILRVGLVAVGLDIASRVVGIGDGVLSGGGGRSILIVLALLGALARLGTGDRALEDAGFLPGRGWARHLSGGLIVGLAVASAYLALAAALGALTRGAVPHEVEFGDVLEGTLTAPLVAAVIVAVFPGWLMAHVRERTPGGEGIAVVAVVGAVLIVATEPAQLATWHGWQRVPTFAFMLTILCASRRRTGDIIGGLAVLTGWLAVLRTVRKTRFFAGEGDASIAYWMSPGGDVLGAPALWMLLAVWAAIEWGRASRAAQPPGRSPQELAVASEVFRKLQLLRHMGVMAPVDLWLAELWRARFRIDAIYVPRLLATLFMSGITTIVCLPERVLAPLLLRGRRVKDPVFIVGVHRSGTTHLQNLLALDPQFAVARTRHVMNPMGSLVTSWLIAPLLALALPRARPMDAVRFGLSSPNEEEYAIANTCRLSPDWAVRLPRQADEYLRFMFPEGFTEPERQTWERRYQSFLRRLTAFSRRRPMLKNPYNTGRLSMLIAMYPQARFIHIHRDPVDVYRSNLHLARTAHPLFQLQEEPAGAGWAQRFLKTYRRMEERYYADADALEPGRCVDVRFEDLEHDAMGEIRRIYDALGLTFSARCEQRVNRYIESLRGYRKNPHKPLDPATSRRLCDELSPLFARWDRQPPTPAPPANSELQPSGA